MLRFVRVIDSISKRVGNILCYLVLPIMLTGVYEVAMRYFFNNPTKWVWETNGFLLCVYVALGGGYTLLIRGHVKVDLVYDRLSTRTKSIVDLVSSLFMFVFLGLLLVQGFKMGLFSLHILEHSPTIFRPPIYPFKLILVFGIFLFLLQGVANFVRNIYIARSAKVIGDGT